MRKAAFLLVLASATCWTGCAVPREGSLLREQMRVAQEQIAVLRNLLLELVPLELARIDHEVEQFRNSLEGRVADVTVPVRDPITGKITKEEVVRADYSETRKEMHRLTGERQRWRMMHNFLGADFLVLRLQQDSGRRTDALAEVMERIKREREEARLKLEGIEIQQERLNDILTWFEKPIADLKARRPTY